MGVGGFQSFIIAAVILAVHTQLGPKAPALDRSLIVAAQRGDVDAVRRLLDEGASVDATEHGGTALIHAADRGNLDLVKVLLERGADPNKKDLRLGKTPLGIAIRPIGVITDRPTRKEIVKLLLDGGADGREALASLIEGGYVDYANAILKRGGLDPSYLNRALAAAVGAGQPELIKLLIDSGATPPGPLDSPTSPERLNHLAGLYRSGSRAEITLTVDDDALRLTTRGRAPILLFVLDLTTLRSAEMNVVATLKTPRQAPLEIALTENGVTEVFTRVQPVEAR